MQLTPLNTKTNLQVAVLSCVDTKMVIFLSKTAPDIAVHTDTCPSVSLTGKADCVNPICTTTRSEIHIITPEQYDVEYLAQYLFTPGPSPFTCSSDLYLSIGGPAIFTHASAKI